MNHLSPAEIERLSLLAEEAGEVVQAVGKILRHGYESQHPDGGPTNRENLQREIGDLAAACQLMVSNYDLSAESLELARDTKLLNVRKYLHHEHNLPETE